MIQKAIPCTVKLPRAASPESVGVDSKTVMAYVKEVEKRGFCFDSLMIIRHGQVAAEFVWEPFDFDVPHDMYSFSKTVTATAAGFAIDEGLLSLDTKVYSFFPEKYQKLTGAQKDYADKLTVHSLLTMKSGKLINMFKNTEKMDWADSYMSARFKCAPDKKWDYVSENIYMLSKIINIVTGMSMTEYLTPRLYEPLEFGVPFWERDHDGVEAGGWGLQLTIEQMAKFSLLYLQNGMWNGKQILPKSWLSVCTKRYLDTVPCIIHEGTGYGYQIWLNDNPNYLRFDGLYGQISVMFKDFDACVIFNARDPREFEFIKMIFDYFPAAFKDSLEPLSDSQLAEFKAQSCRKCYDYSPASPRNVEAEQAISGKKIMLRPRDNASILGAPGFFTWAKKPGRMEYIEFDFSTDPPKFIWKEKNSPENRADIGMDGSFAVSDVILADNPIKTAIQGNWLKDNRLKINIHPLGCSQNRLMIFSFNGKKVKITSKGSLGIDKLLKFWIMFFGIRVPDFMDGVFEFILKIANEIWFDPNLKGTFD